MGCIHIQACANMDCTEYIPWQEITVFDVSRELLKTVVTNENGSVCTPAAVEEEVVISARCLDGSHANVTVMPESISSCSNGDCVEVALVLRCAEEVTTIPDLTTDGEMGCIHIQACANVDCTEYIPWQEIM
ncbi:uncharacterized protein LOC117121812 [Anneissia japonica]|uniref:uncharacterized protein LOC117121812 n=1 Tax=Anneissia japonica TaxID=1529436 RepID=UPI001425647D|nr:uncharacterized protein LOC117121812 [Anneissia japonica]